MDLISPDGKMIRYPEQENRRNRAYSPETKMFLKYKKNRIYAVFRKSER